MQQQHQHQHQKQITIMQHQHQHQHQPLQSSSGEEIESCVQYIIALLRPTIEPESELETTFSTCLKSLLTTKYATHWYPNQPSQGSAYRCLVFIPPQIDTTVEAALVECGINVESLRTDGCPLVKGELRMWVDPGDVSIKLGDNYTQQIFGTANAHVQAQSPPSARRGNSLTPVLPRRQISQSNPKLSSRANTFTPTMTRRTMNAPMIVMNNDSLNNNIFAQHQYHQQQQHRHAKQSPTTYRKHNNKANHRNSNHHQQTKQNINRTDYRSNNRSKHHHAHNNTNNTSLFQRNMPQPQHSLFLQQLVSIVAN